MLVVFPSRRGWTGASTGAWVGGVGSSLFEPSDDVLLAGPEAAGRVQRGAVGVVGFPVQVSAGGQEAFGGAALPARAGMPKRLTPSQKRRDFLRPFCPLCRERWILPGKGSRPSTRGVSAGARFFLVEESGPTLDLVGFGREHGSGDVPQIGVGVGRCCRLAGRAPVESEPDTAAASWRGRVFVACAGCGARARRPDRALERRGRLECLEAARLERRRETGGRPGLCG